MARQRKKHHFWRNLLILIVLFGIYLYWGNRSIETDEATFTSGALPAGFDGCRIVQLSDLHGKYFPDCGLCSGSQRQPFACFQRKDPYLPGCCNLPFIKGPGRSRHACIKRSRGMRIYR